MCCPNNHKPTLITWLYISPTGSRDECYRAMVKAIKKNQNVVLDRCNVQMKERKMWLKDIQEVIGSMKSEKLNKNIVTECAMMKATPEECKQRAKTRIDHPTLKADDPDKIDKVIGLFARQLNVPAEREGFKHVSFISSIDEAKQFVKAITELYQ
eukprot:GEZU01014910.1.p1 GENE.GEZU01014910.1~~GEZU01014910.1.p1  ORF type:complete len:155 (+),score=23.21 GEZU01014910.1:33-497(+)